MVVAVLLDVHAAVGFSKKFFRVRRRHGEKWRNTTLSESRSSPQLLVRLWCEIAQARAARSDLGAVGSARSHNDKFVARHAAT